MAKSKGIICVIILYCLFSTMLPPLHRQTVPKVLEEIEKEKSKLDNQEFFNGLKNIKKKSRQISVVVKSLVIIAEELQNIVDFDTYKNQLIGKSKSINELNLIANMMTRDFRAKEFPLVRVILPKQELKPDGATIFLRS